jgi:hypothetical protein
MHLHPNLLNMDSESPYKAHNIELNSTVSLEFGSFVCSANRIGNGFKVIGCKLGFNRSRGILVKAGNGIIQGNHVDKCWMESIKLTPEFWHMEAGCSRNVIIRDNVIENSGPGAISVVSKALNHNTSPPGIHQNILITGNRISNSECPQILVSSTDGISITENKIEVQSENDMNEAIQLIECMHKDLSKNQIIER